ncbi:MAG: hypothetical protein AAGG01_01425 [Planctomycetota bacterium]
MRWRSEVTPAIGIGFLCAGVSWWSAPFSPQGVARIEIPGFSTLAAPRSSLRDLPEKLLRREAELNALSAAPLPTDPADGESALEKQLILEVDDDLLFRGWTHVSSILELRADQARDRGAYLGVPAERWERRLRETTRKAWIHCPEELLPVFGAMLLDRFNRRPDDLDSLDQAFLRAVRRTLNERR